MNGQLSLADAPLTRITDPATSHHAAARVASARPSLRRDILRVFRTCFALTDDELCRALDVEVRKWPSVKTARSAMKKAGLLEASGVERGGQMVWRLVDIATVRVDDRL